MLFETRLAYLDHRITEERRSLEAIKDVRFAGIGGLVLNPLLTLSKSRKSLGIRIMERDKASTIRNQDRIKRLDEKFATNREAQWDRLRTAIDNLDAKRARRTTRNTDPVMPVVAVLEAAVDVPTTVTTEHPLVNTPIDDSAAQQIANALLSTPPSHEQ